MVFFVILVVVYLSDVIYGCEIDGCAYNTQYKGAMKVHLEARHQAQERYRCAMCIYATNNRFSYLKHIKIHNDDKIHKCKKCDHRAVTRHDLLRHNRSHTREKVYFCDRCRFSTSYCSAMKLHLMHHNDFKPWTCTHCLQFSGCTKTAVIRHIHLLHREVVDVASFIKKDTSTFTVDMSQYRRKPKYEYKTVVKEEIITSDDLADKHDITSDHSPESLAALQLQQLANGSYPK